MRTLQDFYDRYAQWLNEDAPEGNPFNRAWSLCTNLYFFSDCDDDVCYEMSKQFNAAGLSHDFPFNVDWEDYSKGVSCDETYLNDKRRKWVFDHASNVSHTKSSPLLLEFYKWWLNSGEANDTKGLCSNLLSWWRTTEGEDHACKEKWDQYCRLHTEMASQFIFAGLSEHVPFNENYEAYLKEGLDVACRLNKERLAWVEQRIQSGEDTCSE